MKEIFVLEYVLRQATIDSDYSFTLKELRQNTNIATSKLYEIVNHFKDECIFIMLSREKQKQILKLSPEILAYKPHQVLELLKRYLTK